MVDRVFRKTGGGFGVGLLMYNLIFFKYIFICTVFRQMYVNGRQIKFWYIIFNIHVFAKLFSIDAVKQETESKCNGCNV